MVQDKYPQWMKMRIVESAAATYTKVEFQTPVISGPNSYYIMNVLGFYNEILFGDGAQLVTLKSTGGGIMLTKDEHSAGVLPDHEDAIIYFSMHPLTLTSGAVVMSATWVPVNDGQGNGILISDTKVWLSIQGDTDNATALTGNLWLLYKMVKVSANELLDMLQDD